MPPTAFSKILIANRSEIAVRVTRTARAMGYRTVAVYSDADRRAVHTTVTDEAVHIGGAASSDSYLNIDHIIRAARRVGADAIHPGYGFLSENAHFASACREAGIVFIGPSPEAIAAMGDKGTAKRLMIEAGVPCIPGYNGDVQDDDHLLEQARLLGFPLMIKAAAGGGGRGIRRVGSVEEFTTALRSARSEAVGAFGDSRVILERAIIAPRHVEVQVFADRYGNVIHLGERDCSVQRRHQKVIEEAPSPAVNAALREQMGAAAVRACAAIGYEGAGTIEYLLDAEGRYYFMEMNTRLQVEHPVTEAITGLDLVELQLRVAAGEPLPIRQENVTFKGHAIEVRLCSEDAEEGFAPQSGRMQLWVPPAGVRVDHALASGADVPPHYDSMIAKVVASGPTRDDARRRLIMAVEDFVAFGPRSNQAFLVLCLRHPVFAGGHATTDFIDGQMEQLRSADPAHAHRVRALAALLLQLAHMPSTADEAKSGITPRMSVATRFELGGEVVEADVEGSYADLCRVTVAGVSSEMSVVGVENHRAHVVCDGDRENITFIQADDELLFLHGGRVYRVRDQRLLPLTRGAAGHDGKIRASMTGRVVALHAAVGAHVQAGQPVVTIEAMKMEHTLIAPISGVLTHLLAELNQQVTAHRVVAEIAHGTASASEPTGGSGGAGGNT
jgi:geranyl-CoA carboxylase alpha subunit